MVQFFCSFKGRKGRHRLSCQRVKQRRNRSLPGYPPRGPAVTRRLTPSLVTICPANSSPFRGALWSFCTRFPVVQEKFLDLTFRPCSLFFLPSVSGPRGPFSQKSPHFFPSSLMTRHNVLFFSTGQIDRLPITKSHSLC